MNFKRIYKRYLTLKWTFISVHRTHYKSPKGLRDVPYTVLRLIKLAHRGIRGEDTDELIDNTVKELARRHALEKNLF